MAERAAAPARGPLALAWLCAAAAVVAFFLPWAHIEVRDPSARLSKAASDAGLGEALGRVTLSIRQGTRTVEGALPSLQDLPKQVSGFDVPRLAHQENAQLAMAVVEFLTDQPQHVGAKSYAVYAVPGLALLGALALTLLPGKAAATAIGAVCGVVVLAGGWKLATTDTSTLVAAITIGIGLWISLGAYAGLAAAAAWSSQRGRAPTALGISRLP